MARNLNTKDLGGVILGCTNTTMNECFAKNLFGLPSVHFLYVQKIRPGLPLFLFNYTDRKMHGRYEAVTSGQYNADPYAWTKDGRERTPYPAQVRVRVIVQCEALLEKQFKNVIEDNYYSDHHFYFELDHTQTKMLESLFKPLSIPPSIKEPAATSFVVKPSTQAPTSTWKEIFNKEKAGPVPIKVKTTRSYADTLRLSALESAGSSDFNEGTRGCNTRSRSPSVHVDAKEPTVESEHLVGSTAGDDAGLLKQPSFKEEPSEEMERISQKLKGLYVEQLSSIPLSRDNDDGSLIPGINQNPYKEPLVTGESSVQQDSEVLQIIRTLTQRMTSLEKKQAESDQELQELRNDVKESGLTIQQLNKRVEDLKFQHNSLSLDHSQPAVESLKLIYLIGGYDGFSWDSALDAFSPSEDKLIHLKPMNFPRCYFSATALHGNIFAIGGGEGDNGLWYPTVECYNRCEDNWTLCPPLNCAKGNCSAGTLDNKIYAIGGGDGTDILTDVEMFDPILGKWIYCQSMFHRRFSPASVQLDGALYAVGGYDGNFYLQSAERYDPREGYWMRIPNMNDKRGCHSLAVLDNKMYAMGGYNGERMTSSVEVFDPRLDSWILTDPMDAPKGNAAAGVVDDTLFVIGGTDGGNFLDIVECYKEGAGWSVCPFGAIKKRSFFSAVVL